VITVDREEVPGGLIVRLHGTIEENMNFEQLIGNFEGLLNVNCRGITRINSVGVKTWIRYFQNLKAMGKQFKFSDCSHPIVEQMNVISNFSCGGEIESVLLPYSCAKCAKEFVATVKTADLKARGLQIPKVKCEKADCGAVFDDDPEEYLYFLEE
jgi:anti-anti-sigma regulatory factor